MPSSWDKAALRGAGGGRAHLRAGHAQDRRRLRPVSRHALAGLPRRGRRDPAHEHGGERHRRARWSPTSGEPAITYYFSTSGGQTENVELSFLGSAPKAWLEERGGPLRRHLARSTAGASASPRRARRPPRGARAVPQDPRAPPRQLARASCARGCTDRAARAILTGAQIRARLGLYDSWAYFTKVSTSQVRRATSPRTTTRAEKPARREIAGVFDPPPRSRSLLVERRIRGRWRPAGRIQTTRTGRYRTQLAARGLYRIRSGGVAGPAVRVR